MYKRQGPPPGAGGSGGIRSGADGAAGGGSGEPPLAVRDWPQLEQKRLPVGLTVPQCWHCLLYTSDAADDLLCVDLGGRRSIKKKNKTKLHTHCTPQ